ncbi:hypothetical protein AYO08_10205 [Pseudomonas putida]|uniref:hypothetical protein n=1 Tax=Pseudomonas TaxID=286 RepID=UPI0007DC06B8|nr:MULTISPECIES: hypothetical protein [Pseudomonas]OAS07699.1 hypothetical protein AYO08_10205 [Pseudomonas putida]OOV96790.1 hypothetical protein MF6396_21075 [Pseudomonas sp. MF6396]
MDTAKPPSHPLQQLHHAYQAINERFFSGSLPGCEIRFSTRQGSEGHYRPGALPSGELCPALDQIAVGAHLSSSKMIESLAHQACHQYRQHSGQPPRRAYHDQVWAEKMVEIGLQPSSTGLPGGQVIGQKVSHYLLEGGGLSLLIRELHDQGLNINLARAAGPAGAGRRSAQKKVWARTKYTCAGCNKSVLGGDQFNLVCGDCQLPLTPEVSTAGAIEREGAEMLAEEGALHTAPSSWEQSVA